MTDREIEDLRRRVDLVAFLGSETRCHRCGEDVGVTADSWWCEKCQSGGDVFRWVMARDNASFAEAVSSVAEAHRS